MSTSMVVLLNAELPFEKIFWIRIKTNTKAQQTDKRPNNLNLFFRIITFF